MRAVALLLIGLVMAGCGDQDGGWVFASQQRKAERLLGTSLPREAQDVHFHRYQHGGEFGDVDKYSAYLKFRASHADYLEFTQRLGIVVLPGSAPELRARLPGDWKLASGLQLDWWDPTLDIPDDTGQGSFGRNGFIVSKHERELVYLKASDWGVEVP